MAVHAQGQGLEATHQQIRILGRHHSSGKVLEALQANPVSQGLAGNDDARGNVAVPAEVLGG